MEAALGRGLRGSAEFEGFVRGERGVDRLRGRRRRREGNQAEDDE